MDLNKKSVESESGLYGFCLGRLVSPLYHELVGLDDVVGIDCNDPL
jgi:hypothetical protein